MLRSQVPVRFWNSTIAATARVAPPSCGRAFRGIVHQQIPQAAPTVRVIRPQGTRLNRMRKLCSVRTEGTLASRHASNMAGLSCGRNYEHARHPAPPRPVAAPARGTAGCHHLKGGRRACLTRPLIASFVTVKRKHRRGAASIAPFCREHEILATGDLIKVMDHRTRIDRSLTGFDRLQWWSRRAAVPYGILGQRYLAHVAAQVGSGAAATCTKLFAVFSKNRN